VSLRRLIFLIRYSPLMLRDIVYCMVKGVKWHHSWRFWRTPHIKICRGGSLRIGHRFVACSDLVHNPLGAPHPVVLYVNKAGIMKIGDDVGITGSSIVCFDRITIGNNVLIGPGCSIIDTDGHGVNPFDRRNSEASSAPIFIEDGVFIGTKSIILKGVRIGEGAIIAAGSVVMESVPSFTIVAGNPAMKLKRKKRLEDN
jgi:acetyltransferase-like isoleucine patch superfamily enzyme